MKSTLVTGGAGFIGSHLVQLLVKEGIPVRVLERPGAAVNHLPLTKIDLVRAEFATGQLSPLRARLRGSLSPANPNL